MYAVIAHGGKQHRVSPGDVVRLERFDAAAGDSVELGEVKLVATDGEVQTGDAASARKVVGTVLRQARAAKVLVFKKKRRKQYRRTRGHRQSFTELRIDSIE